MFCPRLFLIVGIVVHDLLEDLTVVAGINGTHGQILEEADDVDRARRPENHTVEITPTIAGIIREVM